MKYTGFFSLLFVLVIGSLLSCGTQKNNLPKDMEKNITGDHGIAWKKIDSLENQGLPKSALEELELLYEKVKATDNEAQKIKCLIYRAKYQSQLEEEGLVNAIDRLQQERDEVANPSKAILQSMLAEMYSRYFQNNNWKIKNRTETPDFKPADIRTWSAKHFIEESNKLYWASLADQSMKEIDIKNYDAILFQGTFNEGLRPSLFDFLAHRALDHFMNNATTLTEPVYKFYLDQKESFSSVQSFINFNFDTKDTNSTVYNTILLYQNLLSIHADKPTSRALLHTNLKRLAYVRTNAVHPEKDELYYAALEDLLKAYESQSVASEIIYQMASFHYQSGFGNNYGPEDEKRFAWKKAYDLCKDAVSKYEDSFGAEQCKALMSEITTSSLAFKMNKVNLPNTKMLSLLEYRNLRKVWLKLIPLTQDDIDALNFVKYDEYDQFFAKFKSTKQWSQKLPDEGDYRGHSVELGIDGLPLGIYAVLVADNQEFSGKSNAMVYTIVHVSNLSYWSRDKEESSEFVITDRESGAPIPNVKADFFEQRYNNKRREYEYKKITSAETDQDGFVQLESTGNRNVRVKLTKGEDVLFLEDGYYNYNRKRKKKVRQFTHFFLDRAIYRPGQTVYFKGLLIEKDLASMPGILPNKEVAITFYNVNNQKVKTLDLRTNEYGTVSGSFIAPDGVLNGRMSIMSSVGGSRQYFRVEEYKRPKFEVVFQPVEGSFKLGDEITVKGNAKAFAGNNIDGATVNYRVVREARYPWMPRWYWRGGYPTSPSMEILNGSTTTDEKGEYEIQFSALPDKSIAAQTKPLFTYTVYADVVDISGETRSGSTGVSVGYIGLLADVLVPSLANRDSLKKIEIQTTNLNAQFEAAKGEIIINRLRTPNQTFRKRNWNKPDLDLMTEADFRKDFPFDSWKQEDLIHNWEVEEQVLKVNFNTADKKEITVPTQDWASGAYQIILKTQDKFGQAVEVKKHFKLYDLNESKVPTNEIDFSLQEVNVFQPGEQAAFYLGSAEEKIKVLYQIGVDHEVFYQEWLDIDQLTRLNFDILEKHRGNVFYLFTFVKNNRLYSTNKSLYIPWKNKELNIEYSTFRDKLYPGQQEEWKIKISGNKKDRLAAEMVATLYDESLDQFAANNWNLSLYPVNQALRKVQSRNFRNENGRLMAIDWQNRYNSSGQSFRRLNWFNFQFYHLGGVRLRGRRAGPIYLVDGVRVEAEEMAAPMSEDMGDVRIRGKALSSENIASLPTKDVNAIAATAAGIRSENKSDTIEKDKQFDTDDIQVRTNLNETVFFMPDLKTDAEGNVIISFKMNEALTRWKFLGLAHTKDLEFGLTSNSLVTQKDLMVVPNVPRFFREDDQIEFTAKVSNLTAQSLKGEAMLQLFDAVTNKPVDQLLGNTNAVIPFSTEGGRSARLSWKLKIPVGQVNAITHRVVAKAGQFSDGEESSMPILSNRMLVTETLPLSVRGGQTKDFVFNGLKNAGTSKTLQHHKLTLEFTPNPAWYAVQALPYLMEYPHECTEQIFNRYYANSLASAVANSHPKIKTVFEQWKNTDAMLSNLSKNQELKALLLEETPWVLAAQSEEEQKKNIGVLFDMVRMSKEQAATLKKISERQLSNGGFAWFPGGKDNWYISQYLVEGLGHLDKLGANNWPRDEQLGTMMKSVVKYIDDRIVEHYENLEKRIKRYDGNLEDDHLDQMAAHYLYARSFFLAIPMDKTTTKVRDYYLGQSEKYWNKKSLYTEGMIALALHRYERPGKVTDIIKSLRERALNNEEMGMYWKYDRGFYWYELPIENHALMIELFDEVAQDAASVDALKVWLLKNKQTKHWKTTKATAAAIYSLLLRGDNWLMEEQPITISLGGKELNQANLKKEPGTGYFKTSWEGKEVTTDLSDIKVSNPNKGVAWGGVYWQYFEQLDKIKTFEETPLTLKKQLFKEESSDTGPVMKLLSDENVLTPGDKVKVRIELRVDRAMEYVHMKDMRASGFEPLNVLSTYKWQEGLGYYESTQDAATHFFISYLPPGTYVFEYPLRVSHKGDFSNGITSIQCMYAPEFSSHSEGIRVKVK